MHLTNKKVSRARLTPEPFWGCRYGCMLGARVGARFWNGPHPERAARYERAGGMATGRNRLGHARTWSSKLHCKMRKPWGEGRGGAGQGHTISCRNPERVLQLSRGILADIHSLCKHYDSMLRVGKPRG